MNIRMAALLLLIGSITFSGCASKKISKTAFKEAVHSMDYYEYVETNKTPKGRTFSEDFLPCLDVEASEFKNAFNTLAVECFDRELEDAPETLDLNSSEFKAIENSVKTCIYIKLLKEMKDDFTFDKSPDRVDHCKIIYEKIKTIK